MEQNIVSVISESVELARSGTDYMGECPFCNDKTPSLSVIPGLNVYHCFACRTHGDVFTFVMKRDGVSLEEAIRHLADREIKAGADPAPSPLVD